jgi:hypothetical protein
MAASLCVKLAVNLGKPAQPTISPLMKIKKPTRRLRFALLGRLVLLAQRVQLMYLACAVLVLATEPSGPWLQMPEKSPFVVAEDRLALRILHKFVN